MSLTLACRYHPVNFSRHMHICTLVSQGYVGADTGAVGAAQHTSGTGWQN